MHERWCENWTLWFHYCRNGTEKASLFVCKFNSKGSNTDTPCSCLFNIKRQARNAGWQQPSRAEKLVWWTTIGYLVRVGGNKNVHEGTSWRSHCHSIDQIAAQVGACAARNTIHENTQFRLTLILSSSANKLHFQRKWRQWMQNCFAWLRRQALPSQRIWSCRQNLLQFRVFLLPTYSATVLLPTYSEITTIHTFHTTFYQNVH
jgi:hypothetical protein